MSAVVMDITGIDATTGVTWRMKRWSDGRVAVWRLMFVGERGAA